MYDISAMLFILVFLGFGIFVVVIYGFFLFFKDKLIQLDVELSENKKIEIVFKKAKNILKKGGSACFISRGITAYAYNYEDFVRYFNSKTFTLSSISTSEDVIYKFENNSLIIE